MGKIMLINGSPRAPKSNSKRYADIFSKSCKKPVEYFQISKNNHVMLCEKMETYSDVVLIFPLYADGIPVTLLNFLKTLEKNPPTSKPSVSVLVNCGFIEPYQNDVAVKMIRLFCTQNGYNFGSALKIGSGEAILDTPFRMLIVRKIRKFVGSIVNKKYDVFMVTMPLTKKMFLQASTKFWISYGAKFGTSKEEMDTMKIEE